jgi:hypothetical protein
MKRVRIFSVKRLLLSIVLGVLFLCSYVFGLFLIDSAGQTPPNLMLVVIGWPRWLWIFVGGQFSEENMVVLTFVAICDAVLYAVIIYAILLALAIVRRKRTVGDLPLPPQPRDFSSSPATSN